MNESIPDTLHDCTISRLGAQGDGVVDQEGGALFVPYALPGEKVRVRVGVGGTLLEDVLTRSPDRVAPICSHFTRCGGCVTQHIDRAVEGAWKTALVSNAFSRLHRTNPAPLSPLVTGAAHSRRRAVFSARKVRSGVVFGFHEHRSNDIVDILECPILMEAIEERIGALKLLLTAVVSRSGEARATVVAADNGVDVTLEGTKPDLTVEERAYIGDLARQARIIRLTIAGMTVYQSAHPTVRFGRVDVAIPTGAFLQAVPAIEVAMAELITRAIPKAKRVADLFSGLGTFTFPIAAKAEVLAVDGDKAAIAALQDGYRRAQGVKPVTAKVRDLFTEPLSAKELEPFDAVVFDPPRAGAEAQARMIAKSKVETVIAVSCAPGTLVRDVAILTDGGYELESVTPIDQFIFSPHIEAIAILRRPKRR